MPIPKKQSRAKYRQQGTILRQRGTASQAEQPCHYRSDPPDVSRLDRRRLPRCPCLHTAPRCDRPDDLLPPIDPNPWRQPRRGNERNYAITRQLRQQPMERPPSIRHVFLGIVDRTTFWVHRTTKCRDPNAPSNLNRSMIHDFSLTDWQQLASERKINIRAAHPHPKPYWTSS